MKKMKAILYPLEDISLPRYIKLKQEIEIVGALTLPCENIAETYVPINKNPIPLSKEIEDFHDFDTLILLPLPCEKKCMSAVKSQITYCLEHNISVYANDKFVSEHGEIPMNSLSDLIEKDYSIAPFHYEKIRKHITPIVTIISAGENAQKFQTLLSVSAEMQRLGFKATAISSRAESSIYGCYDFPLEAIAKLEEVQKIKYINNYVKEIEKKDRPDIIIISVPGSIMPINDDFPYDFGMLAFEIGNAIKSDYSILNLMCEEYAEDFYHKMISLCDIRLNMTIGSMVIANSTLDISSFDMGKIFYTTIPDEKVARIADQLDCSMPFISTYHVLSEERVQSLCRSIVSTLS